MQPTPPAGSDGRGEHPNTPRNARSHTRSRLTMRPAKLLIRWPIALALVASFLWSGLAAYTTAANAYDGYIRQLPSPDTLKNRDTFQTTKIFDRNGVQLAEITDPAGGKRTLIPLEELPRDLILATIAAEDPSFFVNPGFDVRGIARALYDNVREHGIVSGASTITQQVVRNTMFDEEERTQQTISRKVKELILANIVTRHYSKNQILEMYFNEVYYGHRSYGVEAASESYFGKPAHDLTLAQAAMLAGLPQAPSAYDPYVNLSAAKTRQQYVLDRMVKSGFITEEQAQDVAQQEINLVVQQDQPTLAPHWVNYIKDLLEEKYGPEAVYTKGLQVTTTLDLNLQNLAQQVAQDRIHQYSEEFNAHNAAVVAIDPRTGEILTMLGSIDFSDPTIAGQVNVAVAERQPGSSIKPIVYITAFEQGYTPFTIVQDVPTTFIGEFGQIWKPVDWDYRFRGPVTIRQGLAQSLNLPAVRTLQSIGLPAFIHNAERMGITTFTNRPNLGLAIAIGGGEVKLLELTGAYSVLATLGERHPPVALLKVVDGEGKVLEEFHPTPGERIFDPRLVYMLATVLSDGISRIPAFGVDSPLNLNTRIGAVKTGTTDDYRDVWTIGFTPQLVAGVWVGNSDGQPMKSLLSGRTAGLIWHDFMEGALKDQPVQWYQRPDGMGSRDVCEPDGQPVPGTMVPTVRGECKDVVQEWFPNDMKLVGPLAASAGAGHEVRQPGASQVASLPDTQPPSDNPYVVTLGIDGSTPKNPPINMLQKPATWPVPRVQVRVYAEQHADGLYQITEWSDGTYDSQKVQDAQSAQQAPPTQEAQPTPPAESTQTPPAPTPTPTQTAPRTPARTPVARVKVREYPELHADGLYWVTQYSDGSYDVQKIQTAPDAEAAQVAPVPAQPPAPRVKVREYPEMHADGLYVVTQYSDGSYDVSKVAPAN